MDKNWQNKNQPFKPRGEFNQSLDSNKPFVAKVRDESLNREIEIEFSKDWIVSEITLSTVQYADMFGKSLSRTLTTSQLRNFFGEVRRIQMQVDFRPTDFLLLKPKLAYAAQRKSGAGVKDLKLVLDVAHEAVTSTTDKKIMAERFERFVAFLEAVLAYHKGYGGKDTGR